MTAAGLLRWPALILRIFASPFLLQPGDPFQDRHWLSYPYFPG
jgi:hypothetical protein